MADPQSRAIELLKLEDKEYFAMTDDEVFSLQQEFYASFPKTKRRPDAPPEDPADAPAILAIGAPSRVDLDRDTVIPVLIATRQNGYRQWMVDYGQNACVVVTDLNTGTVHTDRPFTMGKREDTPEPSQTPPGPDAKAATAVVTSVRRIDLRTALDIQWYPTRMAVTFLDYDWVSNTVTVDLVRQGQPQETAKPRHKSAFVKASPGIIPDSTGYSHPERVKRGDRIPVKAQVSIPEGDIAVCASLGPEGGSLVAVSFFLMKLDQPDPARVDIATPLYGEGSDMSQAAFEFDMIEALGAPPPTGEYLTYLVAGNVIAGPHRLTIGSE